MTTAYGNPFIVRPEQLASGEYVSGGGADGTIDRVVALVLQRVNPRPLAPVSGRPVVPGLRGFDMAELLSWAAASAGVRPLLPERTDLLRAHCWQRRAMLRSVAQGLALKGALLFGHGAVGLSLGSRGRVVVHDIAAGVVVDAARMRDWTEATVVPGARGYR